MISYREISDRLDKIVMYPEFDEFDIANAPGFKQPPFNIPPCSTAKGARKKWRDRLSKILTFIKRYRYVQMPKKCPFIHVSTRGKMNNYIWGSHTSVGKAIKYMMEIGLIGYGYNTHYSFGCGKQNICCEFKFYRENAEKFIEFCEENNIEPFVIKDYEYDDKHKNAKEVVELNKAKVLFKQNLRLRKPPTKSEKEFENLLMTYLYENYPQLEFYKKLVDDINKTYYAGVLKDFKIYFEPSFKWSGSRKNVTKIGIRATTSQNNIKKKDRHIVLNQYGFDREKDIGASVPRVTLSLNNGEWFSEYIDLYERIYMNCHQDEPFTKDMRKAIKKLFMRAYFDSTEKCMVHHTWRDMNQKGIIKESVDEQMRKLRNAIQETCGKIYKTEIFLAESCIYLRVLQRLLEEGRKCWLLYDCFYSSSIEGESEEEYSKRIDVYIEESFKEYIEKANKGKIKSKGKKKVVSNI